VAELGSVSVNREKCFSYAICADLLPGVFQLDESGISVARQDVLDSLELLIDAAEECPMQAISVVAAAGRKLYPTA